MKQLSVFCLCMSLVIVGCTPAKITRLQLPDDSQRSEILVYRETSFNAEGIDMVFGADGNDYVSLRNGQYAHMYFRPGTYSFFVRSVGMDQPHVLTISVNANDTVCLKAFADPANYGKSLMPILYHVSSTFLIERANCLSGKELVHYRRVAVEYKNNKGQTTPGDRPRMLD